MAGNQEAPARGPARPPNLMKEQLLEEIQRLEAANTKLQDYNNRGAQEMEATKARMVDLEACLSKPVAKFPGPEKFDRTRGKLRPFLIYMRAYYDNYHIRKAYEKVIAIAGFLTGNTVVCNLQEDKEPELQGHQNKGNTDNIPKDPQWYKIAEKIIDK
ncbi:uncharacterized protein DNG_05128 [Cephalotrichum gorgonifer]|uniref:Uncharacterized protein n=1 Tax=Cephalotrichum gorgonifer TaxID=2041049 RepID=A0AAE8N069_9PEZI|nr:uncharacterized protein DNG_05128 [Cephalotrichum gorgonifer]